MSKITKTIDNYEVKTKSSAQRIKEGKQQLFIGIPKEKDASENRLALRPEAVKVLVNNGHRVLVEKGAGKRSKYLDKDYSDAGADISADAQQVYESADILLKVSPPSIEEIGFMQPKSSIISTLHLPSIEKDILKAINKKHITAIAYEFIEDQVGSLPIVRSMSEIAGSTVMLIAAEYLSSTNKGKGLILGGITGVPPTNVVILGAGTVGEYAARAALGLGANVKVFDNNHYRLRRLKYNLTSPQLYTCIIETVSLGEALSQADVAIGALRPENGRTPVVVSDEMVAGMQANSVIIDVGIDNGGCFATSKTTNHQKPTFLRHDVIHYCVPNIASRVAQTATTALSNFFLPLLLSFANAKGIENMILSDLGFAKGVYTFKGHITQEAISKKLNTPFTDLSLLFAGRKGN
jgi:alanine dehydrogenase